MALYTLKEEKKSSSHELYILHAQQLGEKGGKKS